MAFQQANNKGTLVQGQTISVNKYTVQVERYLSQGGFAHVYLVRTPTPVYGTTHHVLKRIAVPNESMLTEVKKEVDIMRILKGHPNIVHLIDAAWHRTSAGIYEVFILMEYCPGGGIIDMMNRRLRERLTEADILQIFVDVCEGVAAMHNLRPALLHRDLKVENILQSSESLFKLCDFGSASPVPTRLPANTQEIRALEADLNRHTTLQYRAPEMVDPYLRRPIDEKSDVWALGVLLYKLCYYTTPFEEHGPLAILNVQYKIPPYPVYSGQMNSLIASMLREHGAQRPTAFEILNTVHRMRGTKSKFNYTIPSRSQLVPSLPAVSSAPTSSALDDLVSYRPSIASVPQAQAPSSSANPVKNAGVQARERVLEAIAPLRRGRPAPVSLHHAVTGPSSPTKDKAERKAPELEFNDAEDESWRAARGALRGHRSGLMSPTTWVPPAASLDDAWNLVVRGSGGDTGKLKKDRRKTMQGSPSGMVGFGDSFDLGFASSSTAAAAASASGTPWLTQQPSVRPAASTLRPSEIPRFRAPNKPKDAFEGLGLASERAPAPTLGEVQKAMGATGGESFSTNLAVPGRGTSSFNSASNSPRPSPSPRLPLQGLPPAPPASTSWRTSPSPQGQASAPKIDVAIEQRFPALEDLDRVFLSTKSGPASTQPPSHGKSGSFGTPPVLPIQPSQVARTDTNVQRTGNKFSRDGGFHSEQTTGTLALESRDLRTPKREIVGSHLPAPSPTRIPRLPSRAPPPRRQSSHAIQPPPPSQAHKLDEPPSPAQIMRRPAPQDWLTGPDEDETSGTVSKPVLKNTPNKRTSVIVERAPHIPSPQEAVAVAGKPSSPPPSPSPAPTTTPSWIMSMKQTHADTGAGRQPLQPKPGLATGEPRVSAPPPADSWFSGHKRQDTTSTISSDDGPEEAIAYVRPRPTGMRQPVRVEANETAGVSPGRRRRSRSTGRQGSVHELVDLWGGKEERAKSISGTPTGPKLTLTSQEPEDINGSSKSLLFPSADYSPRPRPTSPQPQTSPLIPIDSAKGDLFSSTRRSPRHRKLSTNSRDAGPSPSASAGPATARARPQSMFLNSSTASAAIKFPAASPVDGDSSGLDVPEPDARAQRSTRRTSISDMVQRYEAMGVTPTASPATRLLNSPAAQSGTTLSRSVTTHVPSPSRRGHIGGAVGLPGLADPLRKLPTGIGVSDRPRAELASPSPVGLPGLAVERKPDVSSYLGRRSPTKLDTSLGGGSSSGGGAFGLGLEAPVVRPVQRRSPSPAPPAAGDDSQPPSPEKPYQGVGRLIDEWQRKTTDAEAPRSPVSRRRGGGIVGTNVSASPRRAGLLAGRGVHD
ncbi:hypothetical protein BGW80DRAFT_1354206 [Lactifluus volemus]|nr:hypothetical protein BGW80DRAFT_1354206 [Lactifluus volemus]